MARNMYADLDRSSRARRGRRRRRSIWPVVLVLFLIALLAGSAAFAWEIVFGKRPVLSLNGKSEQFVEAGELYTDSGAEAFLGEENISDQVQVSGAVDTSVPGTYQLVYEVTYRKETYSVSRTVTVQDTTPPEIVLTEPAQPFVISTMDQYQEPGYTATDLVDGDLTGQVSVERMVTDPALVTLVYTVTDRAGNTGRAERLVPLTPETEPATEAAAPADNDSIICLTFDDGPSTKVTPKILDILKENGVHATFFIIKYEDSMIPTLKRMVDEGHTIGIHTWSHEYSECYATMDSYYEGVLRLRDKLKADTGYEAFCCRFPGGASNTVSKKYTPGVMTYLAEKMPAEGIQYYDWNADSTDAEGNNRPVETLVENAVSGFKKGRTNILLCHDTNAKETTAEALQQIINYGKENGFVFQAITPDTKPVHHGINN